MEKFVVRFWLISGDYQEIIEAYTESDARKMILDKYSGKFCQINYSYKILTNTENIKEL